MDVTFFLVGVGGCDIFWVGVGGCGIRDIKYMNQDCSMRSTV